MRKTNLLSTAAALGAALLMALPAAAQQQRGDVNYGFEPPPGMRIPQSAVGGIGAIPNVPTQERIAARISRQNYDGPREMLRAAAEAVRRNEWGRANALLERAETTVLNTGIGRPVTNPEVGFGGTGPGGAVVAQIGEAREAVIRAEPREAIRNIRQALARIDDVQRFDERVARRDLERREFERGYRQGRLDRETFDREYFNRGPVGANEGARGSWIARQTDTVYGGDERYVFGRDTWRGRIPGQPGAEYPPTFNRPGRGGYEAWEATGR